ncbi:MAG: alpha-amylase family glycosyl hydrolase [Fimbriimonadales bacterium]|nr:alpha-amylase family glycosyl hydrolase [Fimbriimonadales bacterium]
MRRNALTLGILLLATTHAQLNWVGNTRLFATGSHQLPSRLGMLDPWQVLTVTTQTSPIAPGQSVQIILTTDNWLSTREYDFSFDFNTGNNTQWYVVLPPFAPGTHVQFYIRARHSSGITVFDNNGGANYSVWVRYAPQYRETPILQWFQTDYRTIMRRLPEVVQAGYGAIYLPSPVKSGGGSLSTGYNPFDLFDVGDRFQRGTVRTQYGTTQELIELIRLAQRLGLEVYCDLVTNHADNRASTTIDRYPGVLPEDFHIRSTADPNNNEVDFNNAPPFGFGTLNYDVVGLADYAHEDGNNTRTGAFNLPSYAQFNAFGKPSFVRHPLNPHYYPTGQPYAEDVRQYLKRWGWFLTRVIGFDGYRIDAARHTPPAFFARVPQQPGGIVSEGDLLPYLYSLKPSLYVFGEVYSGNPYELREYAKTGMNLLDFPMNFTLKDLFNANGFGNIGAALSNTIGADPSTGLPYELGGLARYLGVGFVQSHDDGPPRSNNLAHAWLLTRPGRPKIYYDGNNIDPNNWSHFPRPGRYNALGNGDESLLRLLDVRKRFARGNLVNRWVSNDLYVYERQVNGHSLLLVGLNDRGDLTPLSANVQTNFPPGTVLIDYSGQRPPVTVGSDGRVTITVPPNSAPGNNNNAYGYVLYAPRTPQPVAGERPVRLFDALTNTEFAFQTINTPGGAYATGRSFEAATVTSARITIRVRTDSTGVSALAKFNSGIALGDLQPLQNTPEGLADGFIPMTRLANGEFELRDVDLRSLPQGLHGVQVRVFADTGNRPGLFTDFYAFFYLRRPEGRITVDGDLSDLGTPIAVQTRTPSSNLNRLDALYVRNDHRNLYIGVAGRVDPAENFTNGVVLYLDVDYGLGSGLSQLNQLSDDSGPATRLISNRKLTPPTGFGAEFAVGVFRHKGLHSAPEAGFVGDATAPPLVGAEAGVYRIDPNRLNWLQGIPARITWRPRNNSADPPTGLEIAVPLDALFAGRKASRPIGLFAALLTTGETGAIFSAYDSRRATFGARPPYNSFVLNQFLPSQPNVVVDPGTNPVSVQAVATYTLQAMPTLASGYRLLLEPMRYDPRAQAYRLRGRIANTSGQAIQGPIALVATLPSGVEWLNRTGESLLQQGVAYQLLSESDLPPAGTLTFEVQLRASQPLTRPPKLEVRAGMGAL